MCMRTLFWNTPKSPKSETKPFFLLTATFIVHSAHTHFHSSREGEYATPPFTLVPATSFLVPKKNLLVDHNAA